MLIDLRYLITKYQLHINDVLHIGAHHLEERSIYTQNKIPKVIWVEANPELTAAMKHQFPNEIIYNNCMGSVDNAVHEFYITNNGQSSSLLKLHDHLTMYPHITETKKINVFTLTLDTFAKKHLDELANVNCINLDIQGSELDVLRHGTEFLKQIDYIYTEINTREMYKGCGLFDQLSLFLQEQGFKCVEYKLVDGGWGDALYIRG